MAGHYERKLTAKAGRLELKVPKLKGAVFESAVIERYRRREQSVEESLIDMYLAGVSTRQVDDTGQLLWGDRMPSQTLSGKIKRVYAEIDEWRNRPLESKYPYVFVDGVWHKRSWGGHVENVSVLVAIGINAEGHREVIGVTEGMREDRASWEQFFRGMVERGLKGIRIVVGDRCAGLGGHGRLDAAQGEVPAVHGAFHSQRALEDAAHPQGMGIRRPRPCSPWNPGNPPRQGRGSRQGDGVQEAEDRGELPAGGDRRDDDLPAARISRGAPQEDPHEQHDRTAQPGDQAAHARGRQLPRRQQRPHARLRAHQVRHRERMVNPPLPGHVPAR